MKRKKKKIGISYPNPRKNNSLNFLLKNRIIFFPRLVGNLQF